MKSKSNNPTWVIADTMLTTLQIQRTPFFENPLIPVNKPSKKQNETLLGVLDSFSKRRSFADFSTL